MAAAMAERNGKGAKVFQLFVTLFAQHPQTETSLLSRDARTKRPGVFEFRLPARVSLPDGAAATVQVRAAKAPPAGLGPARAYSLPLGFFPRLGRT